jgi:hypothetical protein
MKFQLKVVKEHRILKARNGMRRSKNKEEGRVKVKLRKIENFSLMRENWKNKSVRMLREMKPKLTKKLTLMLK